MWNSSFLLVVIFFLHNVLRGVSKNWQAWLRVCCRWKNQLWNKNCNFCCYDVYFCRAHYGYIRMHVGAEKLCSVYIRANSCKFKFALLFPCHGNIVLSMPEHMKKCTQVYRNVVMTNGHGFIVLWVLFSMAMCRCCCDSQLGRWWCRVLRFVHLNDISALCVLSHIIYLV